MTKKYNPAKAKKVIEKYSNLDEAIAARIYTSQLIGTDTSLVLHGGGNTSVKIRQKNLLGEDEEILLVKGSGHDLAEIGPEGFTALRLGALSRLKSLGSMSDEEMENQLLSNKIEVANPDPSVEALLHAFLPHKFVDHTHADAILILSNHAEGLALVRKVLGDKVGVLPYMASGFPLAKAVIEMVQESPELEAVVVAYHGIFTFGESAEVSYNRLVQFVSKAEAFIADQTGEVKGEVHPEELMASDIAGLVQILRGTCAYQNTQGKYHRFFVASRTGVEMKRLAGAADAGAWCQSGSLTPDHVIRTKNEYVYVDDCPDSDEELATKLSSLIANFQDRYDAYFKRHSAEKSGKYKKLDSYPRIFLVNGLGLFALGESRKAARIAADIAEHTLKAKNRMKGLGSYIPLDEQHTFEMEYWKLQQKKTSHTAGLLFGQSAIVTGAGGAIGFGIAERLLAEGAVVTLSDIDEPRLKKVQQILSEKYTSERVETIAFDVTDYSQVENALAEISTRVGGLDLVIPNAGVAYVSKIEDMDPDKFDQVTAVNLKGTLNLIKASVPIFRRQGTGGNIVLISSKNVFDPGASFGAYSASKAGAHQISKIAALELAEFGVRVNMVNPDAVFGDEEISSKLWDLIGPDRMKARGLDPKGLQEYYRQRNLLKASVLAEHVGNAVVFFASEQTPTTGATLPVDGGIPAAFPR